MASKKTGQKRIKIPKGLHVGSAKTASQLWSTGSSSPSNQGLSKQASYSTTQVPSFFYSPELTTESWLLPKSRQEILKWCRIFFNLEPYVQSIIKMHALYPFSKFDIITPDKSVTEFYKEMAFNDNFNLYNFMLAASLSFRKFGEAIPFGNMTAYKARDGKTYHKWSKFVLLEPELVEIKQDVWGGSPQFELLPTEDMRKSADHILKANDENTQKLLEQVPPAILEAIQKGQNIPLDPEHVSIIADITDPSATRGTPQIQSLFKVLIYQDWIRLAQSAIAQRYHFPVELWKIGDLSKDPPIIPTQAQLEQYRQLINQSIQNPPFSLVVPPIVSYEAVSTQGKLLPIAPEYEYIQDQLLVGLGVNKELIMGNGPVFSSSKTMALHRLMMEYKAIRDRFEEWMIHHFFRPIAEKNGFYYTENGKQKLLLPQISWYKSLDIEEEQAEKEQYLKLHDKGYISTETLFSKFPNLDFSTEQARLEKEKGTIWDKEKGKRLPETFPAGGAPSVGDVGALPPEPIAPIEPMEPIEEGSPTEEMPPATEVPPLGPETLPAPPVV